MFCTECGTQIEDDALFCPNCGAKIAQEAAAPKAEEPKAVAPAPQPAAEAPKAATTPAPQPVAPASKPVAPAPQSEAPAPKPEEPPKKSHALLIAVICLVVFLLLLIVVCGIALAKYWNSVDEKKEKAQVSRDYGEVPSEEPVQILPSESEATPEPTVEPTAKPTATPEPTVAPTATPEPSMSPEEAFHKYEEQLIAESSKIQLSTAYRAPYAGVDEWYGPASQFDRNVSGVIKTMLCDMDGDGAEEMLVIRVNEGSLEYEVYEFDGTKVDLAASYNTLRKNKDTAMFDKNDRMKLNVYLYPHDGYQFLIERFDVHRDWETAYDGTYLGVLFYSNGSLISLYSKYCTGMDEQSFKADEEDLQWLLEFGLTNSAANYVYVGDPLSFDDGLEEVLYVVATRSEEQILRDQETYDPEAGNVTDLNGVSYYFFNEESEYGKDDELLSVDWLPLEGDYLTGYLVQRNDHSIANTEELGGIINYCDHVSFKDQGDGTLAAWLNELAENAVSKYDGDAVLKSLKEEYEGKAERPYPEEVYVFQPLDCVTVYAEGACVSVGFEWDWYMGGVHNAGGFGLNCNLEEKREITLEEFLGKDADEVRSMVAQGISNVVQMEDNEVFKTKIDKYLSDYGKYAFWFDQDTVYVMFESYSLDMGGGAILVELAR
ncbi:MAG: zinc-ribbon domain-containing protein [Lachnospiraceae bacterium]|nr:zinc-ribbon domain-containing protein [Lachnospiraceae bacterium]